MDHCEIVADGWALGTRVWRVSARLNSRYQQLKAAALKPKGTEVKRSNNDFSHIHKVPTLRHDAPLYSCILCISHKLRLPCPATPWREEQPLRA